MREAGNILSALGALACWYFVAVYWWKTRGDWRHSWAGRHVMLLSANFAVLLTLIVMARLWPTYPGRSLVTIVVYAALVTQLVWQCVLLHRAQRRR